MGKNIVICIDGTGNEYGENNSNVIKLYSVLKCSDQTQIAYYHPGLGTMGSRNALTTLEQWWTRTCGLAFGYGLSDALEECYTYLMEKYQEGDAIYLFGFSRGAYLARALAAMIHMYGLVQKGDEPLIRYILRMFKKKRRVPKDFELAASFKSTFSRQCKIHFVGVWDTVSSVGWLYDPVKLPFTAMNPDVEVGRHAISIDERRCAFRQNLWKVNAAHPQNIKQIWFAGVHSDIGGGYAEAESGLAKITLEWMLAEAEANGLQVHRQHEDEVLGLGNSTMAKPDCLAPMHKSLKGWWWILEVFPRRHMDMSIDPPRMLWKIPLAKPRYIAPGASIHPTVKLRIEGRSDYRPKNLPK